MKGKTALVAGASGLIGSELVKVILDGKEYEQVYAIVRKTLGVQHPKLTEVICDFERLEDYEVYFAVDDVFCCLGTTIKKAKSRDVMFRIDVEYPLEIAKLAMKKGAKHFLLISSMQANSGSRIWYSKIKGILEERLSAIPFESIAILRPSLLLGKREEHRLGEEIASKLLQGLSIILKDSWKSRLGIDAKTVAQAMYNIAQVNKKGISTYSASTIYSIGNNK